MKYALVITETAGGTDAPEAAPTVLLVNTSKEVLLSTATAFNVPAFTCLFNGTDGELAGLPIRLGVIRVEDSVVIGDTLDKSGDVYHKHV